MIDIARLFNTVGPRYLPYAALIAAGAWIIQSATTGLVEYAIANVLIALLAVAGVLYGGLIVFVGWKQESDDRYAMDLHETVDRSLAIEERLIILIENNTDALVSMREKLDVLTSFDAFRAEVMKEIRQIGVAQKSPAPGEGEGNRT